MEIYRQAGLYVSCLTCERKYKWFDTLVKYACAVSNLGGGRVVFGIMDKRPRKVVSSLTFERGSSRPNISNQNTKSRTMLVEKRSVELKNTNV